MLHNSYNTEMFGVLIQFSLMMPFVVVTSCFPPLPPVYMLSLANQLQLHVYCTDM